MVALDSRAACSQGLLLAGLATAAAVSGLQRCRNIRIDGHFSAHRMPNARSALRTTFCVPSYAAYAVMTTSVSCAMSLRGTGGCFGVFGLAPETFSTGFGLPSKQHWPQRGRGVGDAPGPTTGRSPRESASAAREQSSRAAPLSVGFSTRSTKDVSGVSVLQQLSNISAVSPHFRPELAEALSLKATCVLASDVIRTGTIRRIFRPASWS